MLRVVAAAVAALAFAGCGGSPSPALPPPANPPEPTTPLAEPAPTPATQDGATLWVTRDRGAEVLLEATVSAGLSALGALEDEADVDTAYGGRFVTAIDGVEGGLESQEDWFYFLNGIEGDVGASEVTLAVGDVVWWDFRSWREELRRPVVVGAFPEPFVHGWDAGRRPVEVEAPPELAEEAELLGALLGADRAGEGEPHRFVLAVEGGVEGAELSARRGDASASPVTFELVGSLEAVRAAARALVANPAIVRFRYTAQFDGAGNVIG